MTIETQLSSKETHRLKAHQHFYRFHLPHLHLTSVFGDDWFALKAEAFARFFGTPTFLIAQTLIVLVWIVVNMLGYTHFDIYPFILLNLAFSLQAAYAAPLILLAQTRQADRDKAHALADAEHRDELHRISDERATTAVRADENPAGSDAAEHRPDDDGEEPDRARGSADQGCSRRRW